LAFSPDGAGLATGDEQGGATLWQWRSAEPVPLGTHGRWVTGLAFTPDGYELVSAGQDGTVRVWPATAQATVDLACARATSAMSGANETLTEQWFQSVPKSFGMPPCSAAEGRTWTESDRLSQPGTPIPAGSLLPKPGPPVIFYFEALPGSQVIAGDPVLLRWDLVNAKEAYLYAGEEESGVVAPEERSFTPTETTTYRLVARNDQGETERILTITPVKPR
jgi:WD40 repeat protein